MASATNSPSEFKLPDLVVLALILLPGFLSERVAAYYGISPSLSEIETVASALAFTLVNVACVIAGSKLWALIARRPQPSLAALFSPATPLLSMRFISSVLLVSVVTGLAWAYLDSHNLLFRARVSARSSRSPVWNTVFLEHTYPSRFYSHAIIAVASGAVYSGPVILYSQEETDGMVFLRPAFIDAPPATASESSQTSPPYAGRCRIPGGLLLFRTSIHSVAFRDPLKELVRACRDDEIAAFLRVLEKSPQASEARSSGKRTPSSERQKQPR